MNSDDILEQLKTSVAEFDAAIDSIKEEYGDRAYKMKHMDGHYILLDVLICRADTLATIARMEELRAKHV